MAASDDFEASLRRPLDYVPAPPAADPFAQYVSLRRPILQPTQAERDVGITDTSNALTRGLAQGTLELGAAAPALYGAGANLVSPGAGDAALESASGLLRRSAAAGPDVTSFADAQRTGRYGDYVAGQLGRAIPGIALTLAGGGVGGAAVKGLARRTAVDAAESFAARQAARTGAETASRAAVDRAASRLVPAALDAAEPAVTAGRAAGTVAGQYPSVVAGSIEGAPDANGNLVGGLKGADREATAKILTGDLGAATLGALPEFRLLGRIGGTAAQEAIAKNAEAILPRVAKEAAKQGALGAGLGVAQTAAQFAAHKWVNDNVDLLSPSAFQSYLDSALAGGTLGAGLGGAVEGGAALGARLRPDGTPNPQWDKLKTTIRDNLAKFADARDQAFARARGAFEGGKAQEGQPVGEAPPEAAPSPVDAAKDVGGKIGEGLAKVHQTAADLFDKLNTALSTDEGRATVSKAFNDAVGTVKDRFDTDAFQAGLDSLLTSYRSALDKAKTPESQADVIKAYGKVIDDYVSGSAHDAGASFQDNFNRLQDTTALDDRAESILDKMSQRFESGEADAPLASDRAPAQNPVQFESRLQNQLATAIPTDAPIWHFPDAMKPLLASAEKIFTGAELSTTDHRNLDVLRRYAPDTVDQWEATGPTYAKLSKGIEQHAPSEEAKSPSTDFEAALRGNAEDRAAKSAISDSSGEAPTPGEGGDFIPGVRETALADLPHSTLTDRIVQAEPGSGEHTALQGELRSRIFREGGGKDETGQYGPLTQNLSSEKGRALWAAKDPTQHANTIGVGMKDVQTRNGRTVQRQQALQLDNLISRKLTEQPGIGPKAALVQVLGDLHLAGIKVDPETITASRKSVDDPFYTTKGGESYYLSKADAAAIREGLKRQPPGLAKERAPGPVPRPRRRARTDQDAPHPDESPSVRENALLKPVVDENGEPTGAFSRELPRGAEVARGEPDNRVPGPELVPRKAPPINQSGIADVHRTGPYDKILSDAQKARAAAKTPRERAQLAREAGIKIGLAELEKERTAGMSERRYAAAVKELRDPESGKAIDYFSRANDGDFDTFKVREVAPEDATPTPLGELRGETGDALQRAYQRATGRAKGSREAIGELVDRLNAKAQDGKLSGREFDAERQFLQAARDAGFKVDLGDRRTPAARARDVAADAKRPTSELREAVKRGEITQPEADAAERQVRNQPENPRSKAKPADEQVMDELTNRLNDSTSDATKDATDVGAAWRAAKSKATKDLNADGSVAGERRGKFSELFAELAANDKEEASKHNIKAEEAALNAILDRLGIKDRITLSRLPAGFAKRGDYNASSGEIRINNNLHGAERLEVLAHELGHHIIRSELARAMGVKLKDIQHFSLDDVFAKMAEHQPDLHAAISKDYNAWLAGHTPDTTGAEALASKKPVHSAVGIRERNEDPFAMRYHDLTDPKRAAYIRSFEEYVADQISRALTHSEKSPVAKFFKGIADKLKLAYDTLFGGLGGKDYAPAPSVEKWVQSLFDRTTNDVSAALGEPVPAEVARNATTAALHAAAADLPPAGAPPAGGGGGGSGAGPSVPPDGIKAITDFIKYRLPADARRILDQALSRGKATQALERVYADQPDVLKQLRDPETTVEAKAAYAYLAWKRGDFTTGPGGTSALRSISDDLLSIANLSGRGAHAERVFNDIANGRIEAMIKAGETYDVKAREAAYRGTAQKVLNTAAHAYEQVRTPLAKVFNSSIARMRDTGVPAIRRIGALLQRHTGEAGEDPGLAPAVTHVTDRAMRTAGRIFEGLNDREILHTLTALQRQDVGAHNNRKVATAVERARGLFDELHKYARDAGIDLPRRENYFPVVLDLKTAADRAKLTTLLSQPKFEAGIRKALNDQQTPIGDLIERMVGDGNGSTIGGPGEFRAKNYRLMNFVYQLGDDADKATFASLQSKSPADIFARYVQPLVREAEFTRRFGRDGAKLEAYISEAKKQGATNEQVAQVRAAVDGAMGRVGADGSPVLRTLLGANVADRLTGRPGTRKGIAYAQAYQNARLLPLALLSNLVDPVGIAVRTGGDFRTAWDGFKVGMKSLVNKAVREELQGMLRALGSADDFLASDILASNFGRGEGGARKINDFIFRVNGLAGWTKTTRFMALQAAHGFLLKHAAADTPTSRRYLDELGVRPGDIQAENGRVKVLEPSARELATPTERARDERVRNALLRFVDESILRPTSQQAPNWFADPYVGLVTQYKHFAYAIADQIGARIAHEIRHGNASVLVPAMSYLPVIIMSELLRGAIQYGPGGNPNRKDWGPEEYIAYAVDRSGLLGPKLAFSSDAVNDVRHGAPPGTSFAGPMVQQAINVARGRGNIESALPGEALFRHWNG